MSDLKPCPFCGGEAVFHNSLRPPETYPCRVYCDNCWAEVGGYSTEAEAIAAWNSRAEASGCECEMFRYSNVLGPIDEWQCSECRADVNGLADDTPPNYCPNCGCKVVDE